MSNEYIVPLLFIYIVLLIGAYLIISEFKSFKKIETDRLNKYLAVVDKLTEQELINLISKLRELQSNENTKCNEIGLRLDLLEKRLEIRKLKED